MKQSLTKPESEAKIADMFNRIAARYDLLNRLLSCQQDKRWRRVMVSLIPRGTPIKLLDVATGTSDVIIEAHRQLGDQVELYGADISSEMLSLGRKKLDHRKILNSKLSLMSAEKLEFEDRSFHVLTISFGLRNVVNKDKALGEFSRVLKPNGRLYILEFFLPEEGAFARLFQFYFHKILPFLGGLISDKGAYSYLPKSVASSYSLSTLTDVMANRGLKLGTVKNFLFGSCKIVEGIKV
jgi:demethylmenaquinone methyltransferase/2-methoxy-6-polyprenyl-1,4-benzoquinol methylase